MAEISLLCNVYVSVTPGKPFFTGLQFFKIISIDH
jgi:hypothetical protein